MNRVGQPQELKGLKRAIYKHAAPAWGVVAGSSLFVGIIVVTMLGRHLTTKEFLSFFAVLVISMPLCLRATDRFAKLERQKYVDAVDALWRMTEASEMFARQELFALSRQIAGLPDNGPRIELPSARTIAAVLQATKAVDSQASTYEIRKLTKGIWDAAVQYHQAVH